MSVICKNNGLRQEMECLNCNCGLASSGNSELLTADYQNALFQMFDSGDLTMDITINDVFAPGADSYSIDSREELIGWLNLYIVGGMDAVIDGVKLDVLRSG